MLRDGGGIISPTSGTSFTLTNPSGFRGKIAGQYLEIIFDMSYSGENAHFSHITLNGEYVCSGEEQSSSPGNIRTSNKLSFCSGNHRAEKSESEALFVQGRGQICPPENQ